MSAAPFDTGLVITRLREQAMATGLRLVGGSADYRAVRSLQDFPAPCAYVVLAREKAQQTKTGQSLPGRQTPLAQLLEVTFGVVLAVRNYRQLEGDELRNELRDQLDRIRSPLLGWTPPINGGRACQLAGGDLSDYDAGTALWTDVWKTQHIIKPEIPTT